MGINEQVEVVATLACLRLSEGVDSLTDFLDSRISETER